MFQVFDSSAITIVRLDQDIYNRENTILLSTTIASYVPDMPMTSVDAVSPARCLLRMASAHQHFHPHLRFLFR